MFTTPHGYIPCTSWNTPVHSTTYLLTTHVSHILWHNTFISRPGLYSKNSNHCFAITEDVDLYHLEQYRPVSHAQIVDMSAGTIIDSNDYVVCNCNLGAYTLEAPLQQLGYRALTLHIAEIIEESWHMYKPYHDTAAMYCVDADNMVGSTFELIHEITDLLHHFCDNIIEINNNGPLLTVTVYGDYRLKPL